MPSHMPTHISAGRTLAALAALSLLLALGACSTDEPASDAPATEVATDTRSVTHAGNDRVPEGAAWTQHYFPSSDGSDVELHADVLLPEDLAEGEQVPVILSVGTYSGHSGELAVEDLGHTGPSGRFTDLVEGADLFDRGYALVMVDLRGFGGSTGCLDFMGAGEQADVAAAIDWAATQPWSTGAVGMYGKSYDAITGLVGTVLDPEPLRAVVAQAPMWDLHRSMRSNGVPRSPIVDTSRSYNEMAKLPAMPDDDERYQANAAYEADNPECEVANSSGYRTADPESEYWTVRDLAVRAEGTDTPLFVTQGFLEVITEADGVEEFLANHEGPQRGWLGQWDHVRGNDRDAEDRLAMGRDGWFDEVMSFYDLYLKDVEPSVEYPAFSVQDSAGEWRALDTWPAADGAVAVPLGAGSYVDDGAEGDPAVETGNSYVQWSEPLTETTRITGTPRVSLDATGHGNVMVRLYDVAPDGTAVLFDDEVSTLTTGTTAVELRSTDWTLAAGHHLAVEIGTIESGVFSNWIDTPSNQTIEVTGGQLDLALDDPADDVATDGEPSVFMETYAAVSTVPLVIGTPSFTVPTVTAGP